MKNGRPWSQKENDLLASEWPTCLNTRQLIPKFPGRTWASIKNHARQLGFQRNPDAQHASYFTRPQSVHKRSWESIPKLNKFDKLHGDFCVSADWHVPFTDIGMVKAMAAASKKRGITKALILGDFFDGDEFSHWVAIGASPLQVKFGDELQYAAQAMEELLAAYNDGVHFITGNHDERPLRLLRYALTTQDIYALIGRRMAADLREHMEKKIKVSEYPFCHVNDSWFMCHPASYSKIPMAVARDVAEVEQMHVICGNGHLWGMTRDRSGRLYCVDTGAMVDREKVWYSVRRIKRLPRWVNGFTILKENLPYLYDRDMANTIS